MLKKKNQLARRPKNPVEKWAMNMNVHSSGKKIGMVLKRMKIYSPSTIIKRAQIKTHREQSFHFSYWQSLQGVLTLVEKQHVQRERGCRAARYQARGHLGKIHPN